MYIKSNRGGDKYIADGYMYIYDKTSRDGTIKFWRCEFKSDRCRARLHTSVETNEVIKKLNEHKHDPDPQRIVATRMRNLLKRKSDIVSPVPIVKTEIIDNPDEECSSSYQNVYIKEEPDCKIVRVDNEESYSSSSSLNGALSYIDIPLGLKIYDVGSGRKVNFLLDDCKGTNEILIFAREDYRDWAQFMKIIYVDSTFKRCPQMFSQICVIIVERNGYAFSIMYIFLQNTQEETYERMFKTIKNLWPNFEPQIVYTDYTKTPYTVLTKVFPSATIYGCYFFMKELFIKKIEEYKLKDRYNNDTDYAFQVRMIIGIAFVPKEDVQKAVYLLRKCLPMDLLAILYWFEMTFIGQINNGEVRKPAKYPFEMWSVYNKMIKEENYTNDCVEMASKHIHSELETESKLIPQYIVGFQVVQRTADTIYDAFIRGETPPVKIVQERLIYLAKTYSERTLYEYISGIAANIY